MKNEFALAFNEVVEDKGLPKEIVLGALEAAMVSAYRRAVNASNAQHIEAKIDPDSGSVTIFAEKEVVEAVQDDRTEVDLDKARQYDPLTEIGAMVIVESTPDDFGRVAAQTARQVIQQRIREAEREAQFNYYIKQVGEIVSGVVQAVNLQGVTLGLELKAEGIMPRNQQMPREHFRVHDRIRALLMEIKTGNRGPQIVLSRAHRDFLRRLLENEVPEIYHGMVEIRSISREPGHRSKVAVAALQPGVDPVGACVGIRGVRIQAIVRELNDEKIDVIEWNPDPAIYIAKALSPARVTGVYLDDSAQGPKTATVVVPEDQLSLAIGRDGQNARLAAKLTSWRIDIKSLPEAAAEVLYKLQKDPEYKTFAIQEADIIPQVEITLAKKSEGRPVTPEEYHLMGSFVDRVERSVIEKRRAIRKEYEARLKMAQTMVPEGAYELPIQTLGLDEATQLSLIVAEYEYVGDLMLQFFMDPKHLAAIEGIDDEAMTAIESAIELLTVKPSAPTREPEVVAPAEPITKAIEQPVAAAIEEPEVLEEVAAASVAAEPVAEEPVAGEIVEKPEAEPEAEGEVFPDTLEAIFKVKQEMFDIPSSDDEVDEEEDVDSDKATHKQKKKKKAQKRFMDIEYDPEKDVTVFRKRRKREGGEWDNDWEV